MKFKIGDKIQKIKGYRFEGVIIGGGTKLDGERILYMVEVELGRNSGKCLEFHLGINLFPVFIVDKNSLDGTGLGGEEDSVAVGTVLVDDVGFVFFI
jgi:hypothetical protein